jgi:hypothetical protein
MLFLTACPPAIRGSHLALPITLPLIVPCPTVQFLLWVAARKVAYLALPAPQQNAMQYIRTADSIRPALFARVVGFR